MNELHQRVTSAIGVASRAPTLATRAGAWRAVAEAETALVRALPQGEECEIAKGGALRAAGQAGLWAGRELQLQRLVGIFDGWREVLADQCREWGVRPSIRVPLNDKVFLRMVWIEPGTFLMGSPVNEAGRWDDEGPRHKVTLTRGFWMGETAVTQAQWQAVMGNNPSHFKGDNRPVEQVSWDDCRDFCERLHERVPWLGARLPTEAEWEYACRAGTAGPHYGPLDEVAWHSGNSGRETHPVGLKAPNAWGLYDMLGNVLEWCADGVEALVPYPGGDRVDPVGGDVPFGFAESSAVARGTPVPEACGRHTATPIDTTQEGDSTASGWLATEGPLRVIRGGSWSDGARFVRAAYRGAYSPVNRFVLLGFRVAGGAP